MLFYLRFYNIILYNNIEYFYYFVYFSASMKTTLAHHHLTRHSTSIWPIIAHSESVHFALAILSFTLFAFLLTICLLSLIWRTSLNLSQNERCLKTNVGNAFNKTGRQRARGWGWKKVALTKHFYGQINTLFDKLIHKVAQPFLW